MQLSSDNIFYLKGKFINNGLVKERFIDLILFKSNGQMVKTFVLSSRYAPTYNFKTREEAESAVEFIANHIKNNGKYDRFDIEVCEETMSLYELWKSYFI